MRVLGGMRVRNVLLRETKYGNYIKVSSDGKDVKHTLFSLKMSPVSMWNVFSA